MIPFDEFLRVVKLLLVLAAISLFVGLGYRWGAAGMAKDLAAAQQQVVGLSAANAAMSAAVTRQNAAVDAMASVGERLRVQAGKAQAVASAATVVQARQVQRILIERPPAGVDQCAAAAAAFDAELIAERGAK
jgi:hypothetical protein